MLLLKRKAGEAIVVGAELRVEIVSINSTSNQDGTVDILVSEPENPNQRFRLKAGDIKGFAQGSVKFKIFRFSNPSNPNVNLGVAAPRELRVLREELESEGQRAERMKAFNV